MAAATPAAVEPVETAVASAIAAAGWAHWLALAINNILIHPDFIYKSNPSSLQPDPWGWVHRPTLATSGRPSHAAVLPFDIN